MSDALSYLKQLAVIPEVPLHELPGLLGASKAELPGL